ncbi:glycosyltransferase [Mycolicibacterium sp. P1-18]|uniref:glycosyltransferase n=1 Tax=Mycolicibacterium sp. P1-18 TaxID=2024615 RepID=UPI0015661E2C|nr:glycosyltransferase [Mycolicibacterium sp. P1-18]
MDTAWSLHWLFRRRTAYFIHTQDGGLTGEVSDSIWKLASRVHRSLEKSIASRARQVVVFNKDYANIVKGWNNLTQSSPTWFDPGLIASGVSEARADNCVVWVGRLEVPKDPALAIASFEALDAIAPEDEWRLELLGSGSQLQIINEAVNRLPLGLRDRVCVRGRVSPPGVAKLMAQSTVFLMTSHPGYEGYPRVLVEALASGLPAVVTVGSDTGSLIGDGHNGFVTSRDPKEIAAKIRAAAGLSSDSARASVSKLSAPEVIATIFGDETSMCM